MPQTLFRGWMFLLQWEQGVFLQSVPYLASVPDRASQCRGASLSDGKRKWIGNKLIFSQLAVPSFPFDLDPAQNKVADVLQQQRWHYWGLPSLRGSLMPQELSLSCQLWQVRRQHSCESPRVSKETPRLSILLTMYLSIGVYHFISKMSDDSVQQTLTFYSCFLGAKIRGWENLEFKRRRNVWTKGKKSCVFFWHHHSYHCTLCFFPFTAHFTAGRNLFVYLLIARLPYSSWGQRQGLAHDCITGLRVPLGTLEVLDAHSLHEWVIDGRRLNEWMKDWSWWAPPGQFHIFDNF